MADVDYALALSLQNEFSTLDNEITTNSSAKRKNPTSIVDDCWEAIDPTPDIRELFLQFNDMYFDGKLSCCEVKWAPRMTLCAGVCCYEGRGGLCSIKLSMPLLKLRPRKDLVQTLLHEMIHAYLFVTDNNKDHNAHGPEFHKHMDRINKHSGANITVYHNFHDEVDLYRQHWWRCDGPCQKRPPYYGMVRRAMNRAPSPRDPWWPDHQRSCGGTYHKVREPEDYGKKKRKKDENTGGPSKSGGDSQTKGIPKIYDLWKKEVNDKNSRTSGGESLTNDKPSNNKTNSNSNKTSSDDLSTNSKPQIDNFWKVENEKDDPGSSSGKENDVQKINYAITPFTGKGHVLGSVKNDSSTNSLNMRRIVGVVPKRRDFSDNGKGSWGLSKTSKIGSTSSFNENNSNTHLQTSTNSSLKSLNQGRKIGGISNSQGNLKSTIQRKIEGISEDQDNLVSTVPRKIKEISGNHDFQGSVEASSRKKVGGIAQDFQGIDSSVQSNGSSSSESGDFYDNVNSTQSKINSIDINENDFVNDMDIGTSGHLGTVHLVKSDKSISKLPNLNTKSKSTILNISNEDLSKKEKQKVHLGTQLTIVDAFKMVGKKKVPLVVIDQTLPKSGSVQCPVCLAKVEESKINRHLDTCLS